MIVLTEVDAEEDIDQGGAQLAYCDMGFPTQVNRLQRVEQPLPRADTHSLCLHARQSGRPKNTRRAPDLAAFLGRTGLARCPICGRVVPPIELIQQLF